MVNYTRKLQKLSACAAVAVVAASCGSKDDKSSASPETVTISYNIQARDETALGGFSLAGADSYAATISGCKSGYYKAFSESSGSVLIQKGDFSCLFKVSSLVYKGEAFDLSAQSFAQGSSFSATGASGTLLKFEVIRNIDSPASGSQSVLVLFGAYQGNSSTVAANVSKGISVLESAPIDLSVVSYDTVVDASDGAGLFSFKLQCAQVVSGSGASASCNSEVLSTLQVALSLDSSPSAQLSLAQCLALIPGGSSSGTAFDAGSDASYANGGLSTPQMKGPAPLFGAANANLIFAIKGNAGGCKYYRVTVQAP